MDYRIRCIGRFNQNGQLNVIFIHGLGGGLYTTWNGNNDNEIEKNKTANNGYIEIASKINMGGHYWPNLMLEKFHNRNVNVWVIDYPAPKLALKDPYSTESLWTTCSQINNLLDQTDFLTNPNQQHVFIAHSLGGLQVKSMLQRSMTSTNQSIQNIAKNTKGVMFLGTPHSGSGMANAISYLPLLSKPFYSFPLIGKILGTLVSYRLKPSNAIEWLKTNNPELRRMSHEYRQLVEKYDIETKAYYEAKSFKGILKIVDETNADPGILNCEMNAAPNMDHIQIAKPSIDTNLFRDTNIWIQRFIDLNKKGSKVPVLMNEIEDILNQIKHIDSGKYEIHLKNTPQNLSEIIAEDESNNEIRKEISKEFRNRAHSLIKDSLKDRFEKNHNLAKQLEESSFDFDKLILYQWYSFKLNNALDKYKNSLVARDVNLKNENVSLIPLYQLIRSLWSTLQPYSSTIIPEFEGILSKLMKLKHPEPDSKVDSKIDKSNQTEFFLKSSIIAFQELSKWKKKPWK